MLVLDHRSELLKVAKFVACRDLRSEREQGVFFEPHDGRTRFCPVGDRPSFPLSCRYVTDFVFLAMTYRSIISAISRKPASGVHQKDNKEESQC